LKKDKKTGGVFMFEFFSWLKRTLRKNSTSLSSIASSLEAINKHMNEDQAAMEKRIFDSVYKKLSQELIKTAESSKRVKDSAEQVKKDATKKLVLKNSPILNTLHSKGVSINKLQDDGEYEDFLNIARYMGEKHEDIAKFLKKLKATLNSSSTKRICIKNWTDKEISASCQFANMLFKCGILEKYLYFKSPRFEMVFKPSRIPKVINFLTGKWFELYITQFIEQNLRISGTDYTILTNPLVLLPNGKNFEMDILLEINGKLIWMELKTGEYKSYLSKYSTIGKLLDIDPQNRFLILSEETEASCDSLSELYDMNIMNLDMLKKNIHSIIRTLSYDLKVAV